MAEADTVLVPDTARHAAATEQRLTVRPTARRTSRDRRLAVGVGSLALLGAAASVTVGAQVALPGDTLYPMKRAIEDVRTELAVGDARTGRLMLSHATERLEETEGLTRRDDVDVRATEDTLQRLHRAGRGRGGPDDLGVHRQRPAGDHRRAARLHRRQHGPARGPRADLAARGPRRAGRRSGRGGRDRRRRFRHLPVVRRSRCGERAHQPHLGRPAAHHASPTRRPARTARDGPAARTVAGPRRRRSPCPRSPASSRPCCPRCRRLRAVPRRPPGCPPRRPPRRCRRPRAVPSVPLPLPTTVTTLLPPLARRSRRCCRRCRRSPRCCRRCPPSRGSGSVRPWPPPTARRRRPPAPCPDGPQPKTESRSISNV